MARSGVPGIDLPEPENDLNHKTEPCGCTLVRCGPPVNGWVYTRHCDNHQASSA